MPNVYLFVGSHNPVKVNAVTVAASETWPDAQVSGYDVSSGVPDQPRGDEETRLGAENRAKVALIAGLEACTKESHIPQTADIVLGVGLEGGVVTVGEDLYSTVWVAVTDRTGFTTSANGARFKIDPLIAQRINAGEEMGPAVEKIVGESNIRQKQGMIGVVTDGFVDRTEEYATIAKLALGLWYGRNWMRAIEIKK